MKSYEDFKNEAKNLINDFLIKPYEVEYALSNIIDWAYNEGWKHGWHERKESLMKENYKEEEMIK